MNLGIKGKRAIVTGASRGIGEAIAVALSKEGVRVALISRNETLLKNAVKKLEGKGHYCHSCDLTDADGPKKAMEEIKKEFGMPDILVNNLGDTLKIRDALCSLSDWKKVYRINFEVMLEMNNIAIPYMEKNKWGRIVNISSTAGIENNGPVPYCCAKASVTAYTRSMGRVLAKTGIVLSTVIPGIVFTKGGNWDRDLTERPGHVEEFLKRMCPTGDFGKPEYIANMVAMLCSAQAEYCQGSIVPVDGGVARQFFWFN